MLQQTLSAQERPDAHCEVVAQAPPCGTGVLVGVADDVTVGVRVGVAVGVAVGVFWTHDPSAVQLVPAAQHCTPHACPDGQQLPPMQVWPVVQH